MQLLVSSLALLAALGAGLMGGFFYAFSGLVMPALARRPAAEAIGAMREINVVVLNTLFFALFFGPAAIGLALSVLAPFTLPAGEATLAFAASAAYALGCVGVTVARNVPLNEELSRTQPGGAGSEAFWATYLAEWTWWNHVRALACMIACAGFIVVV